MGIALALHAVAIWALLQFDATHRFLTEAVPIMVSFILPPKIEEPPRPVDKPPPPARKPAAQLPVLTTKAIESPAPWIAPEPPTQPPPVESPRAPPAAPAAAPPAPMTPPEFNAAYLRNPPPAYPLLSRRHREQGRVVLRVFVGVDGSAEKIEVQTSSGSPRLDVAAEEAVRAWRFVPARQGDKPVPAWVNVPINFKLEG